MRISNSLSRFLKAINNKKTYKNNSWTTWNHPFAKLQFILPVGKSLKLKFSTTANAELENMGQQKIVQLAISSHLPVTVRDGDGLLSCSLSTKERGGNNYLFIIGYIGGCDCCHRKKNSITQWRKKCNQVEENDSHFRRSREWLIHYEDIQTGNLHWLQSCPVERTHVGLIMRLPT